MFRLTIPCSRTLLLTFLVRTRTSWVRVQVMTPEMTRRPLGLPLTLWTTERLTPTHWGDSLSRPSLPSQLALQLLSVKVLEKFGTPCPCLRYVWLRLLRLATLMMSRPSRLGQWWRHLRMLLLPRPIPVTEPMKSRVLPWTRFWSRSPLNVLSERNTATCLTLHRWLSLRVSVTIREGEATAGAPICTSVLQVIICLARVSKTGRKQQHIRLLCSNRRNLCRARVVHLLWRQMLTLKLFIRFPWDRPIRHTVKLVHPPRAPRLPLLLGH